MDGEKTEGGKLLLCTLTVVKSFGVFACTCNKTICILSTGLFLCTCVVERDDSCMERDGLIREKTDVV